MADETVAVTEITIESTGSAAVETSLVLNFDAPLTDTEVDSAVNEVGADPTTLTIDGDSATALMTIEETSVALTPAAPQANRPTVGVTPMAGPAGGALLRCNQSYRWTDDKGSFTLQHQCGGTTVPWGYQLTPLTQSTVAGTVSEVGMSWSRNGTSMPRNAPHPNVVPNYQFHGTFNPAPDGAHILYQDVFNYRHNIGPGGNAILSINGDFTASGTPPCGSGGPC